MDLTFASAAFALALLAAAAMGLALQRGATCTVAAMDELVNGRRATRLVALTEAALWVGAGLLLAHAWGIQPALPQPPVVSGWTLAGAALLGLGALVNGACVFGAVARLGTGQWAYFATPLGFYGGCLLVTAWWQTRPPLAAENSPPLLHLPAWGTWLLMIGLLLRVAVALVMRRDSLRMAWSPHTATAVIGVAFLVLLLLGGAWAYTDVLAELAAHMAGDVTAGLAQRLALAAALLTGALYGGWAAGQWRWQPPTPAAIARCFAGGALMGCGSVLVPGGNDSLILLGMPLLWPHAWASFAVMCVLIGSVLAVRARL